MLDPNIVSRTQAQPTSRALVPQAYHGLLASYVAISRSSPLWLHVRSTSRVQGWKLHVSVVPRHVPLLLERIMPTLLRSGSAFKIASSADVLERLNEGLLSPTQIGKFMTIYPSNDEQARRMAEELAALTTDIDGPAIVTDMHLGGTIFARFGGFSPVVKRDRLGQRSLLIAHPDGELRPDEYRVPDVSATAESHPFEGLVRQTASAAGVGLLAGRFLLVGVLKYSAKGSVFRAIDLRGTDGVQAVVLKQGRFHCCSDQHGRDMRDRLRTQERLHHELLSITCVPSAGTYFEHHGDGYLPVQYVEGETLLRAFETPWTSLSLRNRRRRLTVLHRLVTAVIALHDAGFVHRDLNPRNIMVSELGEVTIIDFELAQRVADDKPPYTLGTPGFMSPEQMRGDRASPPNDVYAFGALLAMALSSHDPAQLEWGMAEGGGRLEWLAPDAPSALCRLAECCMASRAETRPSGAEVLLGLESYDGKSRQGEQPFGHERLRCAILAGGTGLVHGVRMAKADGLWLSKDVDDASAVTALRSAHRGRAGGLYMLGRMARFGLAPADAKPLALAAFDWLMDRDNGGDAGLPGLFFGEAGVAVAVVEAMAGGLLEKDSSTLDFVDASMARNFDWPDLTHGAAGEGLAALVCGDRLECEDWMGHARRAAEYLCEQQRPDGSWHFPEGVPGLAGEAFTGFAHGAAGILYFLLEYCHRVGDEAAHAALLAGASWLLAQADQTQDREGLTWRWGPDRATKWSWWSHGAPGIALLWLRLYAWTGDERWAVTARRALEGAELGRRNGPLAQCYGLAGLGEVAVEASAVLKAQRWSRHAEQLVNVVLRLGRDTARTGLTWTGELAKEATVDLMVGCGGQIHLLLRHRLGAERLGGPLMPDPVNMVRSQRFHRNLWTGCRPPLRQSNCAL